jgi:hypothetical protein
LRAASAAPCDGIAELAPLANAQRALMAPGILRERGVTNLALVALG